MRKQFEVPLQAHAHPESLAPSAQRSKLLERLYAIYETRGTLASTDSSDIAHRFSIDPELVECAALELHKRHLLTFDTCDQGLIHLRLTTEGIAQIEDPASSADWHAGSKSSA
jgi:hypothetical protein